MVPDTKRTRRAVVGSVGGLVLTASGCVTETGGERKHPIVVRNDQTGTHEVRLRVTNESGSVGFERTYTLSGQYTVNETTAYRGEPAVVHAVVDGERVASAEYAPAEDCGETRIKVLNDVEGDVRIWFAC